MSVSASRAIFLLVIFAVSGSTEAQVVPACPQPAPLEMHGTCGQFGYIVLFVPGSDATVLTPQLEARYGFTATSVLSSGTFQAFNAQLSPQQVALLRCEPSVQGIEANFVINGPPAPCESVPALSSTAIAALAIALAAAGAVALRSL